MTVAAKKLIEVALPLEAINRACKADKDRKTGTIRNLHKWFAPMPSPAWRTLIAAALLDDPGDPLEREGLFELLEAIVDEETPGRASRALAEIRRLIKEQGHELPTVFDPFCGGGSTLLEAQRLGLPACGSDLNPIPVLITRMLTQYLPTRLGQPSITRDPQGTLTEVGAALHGFARDVSHYARRILEEAFRRVGKYYPLAPNGDPIIAWWWARTIPSPDPQFRGAPTPLVNEWWISKKKGERAYVSPVVDRVNGTITFEIVSSESGAPASSKARCLYSDAPIPFAYIKEQGKARKLGTTLLALVAQGSSGRTHFGPSEADIEVARSARPADPPALDLAPQALGFTVQEYGITSWAQLFTERQMLALETFSGLIAEAFEWIIEDGGDREHAISITTFLGLCLGKLAQASSMQVRWHPREGTQAKAEPAFSRPDISPLWDFAETNPFASSVGGWLQVVETALRATEFVVADAKPARVEQRDARTSADLVPAGKCLVATDPPYFSNFGYADLSNYFYVWLRRALKDIHPSLFSTLGAPTTGELIADPTRHGGDKEAAKHYFVKGLQETLEGLTQASRPELPMLVVYAFKQQESTGGRVASTGWEAVLEALIGARLQIVGTWPIHGTGSARARGLSSNALATYVLLVCRERARDAPLATFGEFRDALRSEIQTAIADLRAASIAPVDLAQAVIGPGMAVFSRYGRVVQADGTTVSVRDALGVINRALDEVLEEQETDFDADTRWAVAWFEQYGTGDGPYGVADSLSRAKNTAVNGLEKAGVVASKGGQVRLLSYRELPAEWDPTTDRRITVWEMTHHLVRALADGGESAAADLLRRLGGLGELARELGYRLHSIADRKKWAQEALAYNGLVVAWPEISRLAGRAADTAVQTTLEG